MRLMPALAVMGAIACASPRAMKEDLARAGVLDVSLPPAQPLDLSEGSLPGDVQGQIREEVAQAQARSAREASRGAAPVELSGSVSSVSPGSVTVLARSGLPTTMEFSEQTRLRDVRGEAAPLREGDEVRARYVPSPQGRVLLEVTRLARLPDPEPTPE